MPTTPNDLSLKVLQDMQRSLADISAMMRDSERRQRGITNTGFTSGMAGALAPMRAMEDRLRGGPFSMGDQLSNIRDTLSPHLQQYGGLGSRVSSALGAMSGFSLSDQLGNMGQGLQMNARQNYVTGVFGEQLPGGNAVGAAMNAPGLGNTLAQPSFMKSQLGVGLAGVGKYGGDVLGGIGLGVAAGDLAYQGYQGLRGAYLGAIQPSFQGAQLGAGPAGGNLAQAAMGARPLGYAQLAMGMTPFGATQAQTAGLRMGYQSWMSGLNPTNAFSQAQYQGIQQAVTGMGYGQTSTGVGLQMYNANAQLMQNTGLGATDTQQLLDTTYRRFNMSAGSAADALSGLATAATAALKSVSAYSGEVQNALMTISNQGVTNGPQAVQASQLLSSFPNVSSNQVSGVLGAIAPVLAMQYGQSGKSSQFNSASLVAAFTGNPLDSGGSPSQALSSGLQGLQQIVSGLAQSNRGPGVSAAQARMAAIQQVVTMYGLPVSPQQLSTMLQQAPAVEAQIKTNNIQNNLTGVISSANKTDMAAQWGQQATSIQSTLQGKSGGMVAPSVMALGQLNLNWDAILGPNNNSGNVQKIMDAVQTGNIQSLDPSLRGAAQMILSAVNDPSGKKLAALEGGFGADPNKTLGDMMAKITKQTDNYKALSKSQRTTVSSDLMQMMDAAAHANKASPFAVGGKSYEQNLLAQVQSGSMSISTLTNLIQKYTKGSGSGASVVANGVTVSLDPQAAKYLKLSSPSGSTQSAVTGQPTPANSGTNDRQSAIQAMGGH